MSKMDELNGSRMLRRCIAAGISVVLGMASSVVLAGPEAPALRAAIHDGAKLFAAPSLGSNGRSCQSCHLNGGKGAGILPNGKRIPSLRNAAAIFPRYSGKAGKVRTMTMQVNHCIQGGLGGMPLDYDSSKMVALDSYLNSLATGEPIHMGAKPK
ncbi:MAG: hypothetical protein B7Z66_07830 [Chromatiales bacterium 21-64-14]|nr:MAG: hypothetical protein B7Z66_07830 [Chromatiales bacterium 21-64-14]HQU15964.1 cytochrome C [Gammaproteobacteria bacterium]